jgi:xanthine dehydrogenase accessory factor
MIGSKRKVIEIFKTLQQEGIPAHLFDRVYAPVGLDIGAITPEEIAVAITAELIAVRRHASAALPHMSWFKAAQPEPRGESAGVAEGLKENERNS